MSRRFDWVFLDAGETLFQVAKPLPEYASVLADLGYPLTPERMTAAFRGARWDSLFPDHLGPPPEYEIVAERAAARRERFLGALLRRIGVRPEHASAAGDLIRASMVGTSLFGLYPEVPSVLDELRRRGYRLGIISNWEPRLEALCRSHGLAEHFSFVLASEMEGYAKPSRRIFERALRRAAVEPKRAIHVGDSFEDDVLGANAVGLAAVLLDRGGYYPPERWRPTIRSLDGLCSLL